MTATKPGNSAETPGAAWRAHIDGGSRGNPGDAGYGVTLRDPRGRVEEMYGFIGEATNNVAEYTALIVLLEHAVETGIGHLEVFSDSQLLVRQLNGQYRVKHPVMQRLHARAVALRERIGAVVIRHVPREENRRADRLAQRAMNLRRTVGPHPPEDD